MTADTANAPDPRILRRLVAHDNIQTMKSIVTLTLNPAIDAAYDVDRVVHTHKMRTLNESYDPGGGGINVTRVVARLGGMARALYLAGGATGAALDGLLDMHQMVHTRFGIAGNTRMSANVHERESGKEYRFVPPGPTVTEPEWQACLARLEDFPCDFLVASGSLPPGVPADFYSRVKAIVAARGTRLVLDTSGPALREGLRGGGVFLVKPSLGELQKLVGRSLDGVDAISAAAADIVRQQQAELVAVTMGAKGAVLAREGVTLYLPAIAIEAKSTVGAGDSFVAAMTFALANGWDAVEAFRYGMAAGTAAVLTPGTGLCHPDDIDRMYAMVATPLQSET